MNRWIESNEIEGFDRLTVLCQGCGIPLPLQGKRVPMPRSKFMASPLRCPNCRAVIDRTSLKSIDDAGRGLVGRCGDCKEQFLVELREDA